MRIFAALIIAAGIGYEFQSVRTAGFVYEDALWMEGCPHPLSSMRNLQTALPMDSWCWQLSNGQSVAAFHAVNLGVHLSVALVLGLLVGTLTGSEVAGWIAGALFACHPMVMETAVYLGGRAELFAGLGVVIAAFGAARRFYLLMAAGILIALLSKETGFFAISAAALVTAARARLMWRGEVVAALVALSLFAGSLIYQIGRVTIPARFVWAGVQAGAAASLSAMAIIPFGLTPSHDFLTLPRFLQAASLFLFLMLPVVAWMLRKERPIFALGLSWVFWSILPRLVVPTPPSPLNEHQFYTPLMGMLLMGAGLWR